MTSALSVDDDLKPRLIVTRDMAKVVRRILKTIRSGNIEMPEPVFDRNLLGACRARFSARSRTITILSQEQLDRSRHSSI